MHFFESIFTTDVIQATLIIHQSLYFWKKNTSDINSQLAVGRFVNISLENIGYLENYLRFGRKLIVSISGQSKDNISASSYGPVVRQKVHD
jgi:hypothetical protein